MNRILKLINLQLVLNGGLGSGNPAPGQGRGRGKPGNASFSKSQKDAIKAYTSLGGQLSDKNKWTSEKNKELEKLANSKKETSPGLWRKVGMTQEEKEKIFESRPDVKFDRFESFTEDQIRAYTFPTNKETVLYHIPKGEKIFGINIQKESVYPEEKEHLVGSKNEFSVSDIKFDSGSNMIIELSTKKENQLQFNGGKNSGNHNPGQGRGIGKPNGGGGRLSKATKSFEEYVSKSNKWMPSPERFYAIADSLGYTGEPKIVSNKEFEKAKESGDYISMFRGFRGDAYSGITAIEATEDFLYGDYYAGNGQSRFGDGIYLAGEEGYATHYSEDISDTQSAVLRMLVPKGNYIEIQEDGKFRNKVQQEKFENYYQTKRDEYSAKADELTKKAGQLYKEGHINEGEKVYDEVEKMNDLSNAYGDLKYAQTEYAMMQGYDGVHWDAAQDDDALKEEYVVFDRSKIIVQKPDFL